MPETDQIVMISCLKLLDHVQREIDELEGEIHDKAKDDPNIRLLMGIPGINVLSALTILAEIGDIKRFPTSKKLTSYAGLVPSVHQSGKTRYTGSITKAGRSTLRWILVQCAQRGIRSTSDLQSFYLRLKAKKGHKIAIVATARKLLTIIWAVLTKQEEYKDIRRDLLERKLRALAKKAVKYPRREDLSSLLERVAEMETDDVCTIFVTGAGQGSLRLTMI